MKIKTVIFDFDGVIADTMPYTLSKILTILKKDFGVKLKDQEIIEIIRTNSFRDIIGKLKISLFKLPAIVGKINQSQEELFKVIATIKIFPGMKKLLKDLKTAGYGLEIISSNLKKNIDRFIELREIDYFNNVISGPNILGKSGVISDFLKKEKIDKETVIYIGDEIRDIEACRKSGIKIIAVSWGLQDAKVLKEHGADFIARKPADILRIVLN